MNQKRVAANLAAVEAHFHAEATNEVAAALALYMDADRSQVLVLYGLDRSYAGKEAVTENYRALWASMRDVRFTFLQRFATEDRVVDDSLVTFEVIRDGYWHFPVGSKVEMRPPCTSSRCGTGRSHASWCSTWDGHAGEGAV